MNSSISSNRANFRCWHASGSTTGMHAASASRGSPSRISIGYIALTDAAPLIAGVETGIFARHGLEVTLSREVGWATIRDKIIFGELDAAHALAGMLVSTRLGLDCIPTPVTTGCVLNLHGNAITLGRHLTASGIDNPDALRAEIRRRRSHGKPRLVFGVVFKHSSHHVQLRQWLRQGGIDPDRDVQIVIVPPAQMVRNLTARTIDGFCAGEPWNSVAVANGVGAIVARSCETNTGHIEKVLMVRESFCSEHPRTHARLVAATVEACRWCQDRANHPRLAAILASPGYLGQPETVIRRALDGPMPLGVGTGDVPADDMIVFSGEHTNRPAPARAESVIRGLANTGLLDLPESDIPRLARAIFRDDLFLNHNHANNHTPTHENILS